MTKRIRQMRGSSTDHKNLERRHVSLSDGHASIALLECLKGMDWRNGWRAEEKKPSRQREKAQHDEERREPAAMSAFEVGLNGVLLHGQNMGTRPSGQVPQSALLHFADLRAIYGSDVFSAHGNLFRLPQGQDNRAPAPHAMESTIDWWNSAGNFSVAAGAGMALEGCHVRHYTLPRTVLRPARPQRF